MCRFLSNIANIMPFATPAHFYDAYYGINTSLRDPKGEKFKQIASRMLVSKDSLPDGMTELELLEYTKSIYNREFMFLPKTITRKKMYRGACRLYKEDYDAYLKYSKGQVVVPDAGFAYLTKSRKKAMEYASKNEGQILFEYKIPRRSMISRMNKCFIFLTGKHVCPQSALPAGAICKVYKNSFVDKEGVLHVFLKYLNKWK